MGMTIRTDVSKIIGIDYGAKLAGTTVICHISQGKLALKQSAKKKDADEMILTFAKQLPHSVLYLDAPLSLPIVYRNPNTATPDYFYRKCDKALGAMSPMFLGGLTARAMRLKSCLAPMGIAVKEAYPAAVAKQIAGGLPGYKKDMNQSFEGLEPLLPIPVASPPVNQHQLDSILAWLVGYRHTQGIAQCYGTPEEGEIWV